MSRHRRLSALLVAVVVGAGLTLGVGGEASARTADPGATAPTATPGHRGPQDPATYYASAAGLSGNALALQLNSIIDGNTFVPYTSSSGVDVWKALKVLDQDPNNASRIIDAYSGDSLDAANQCGSSCALDGWNREHTWAQSRGSFNTSAGPGTDLFHMRPLRGNTNSSRGNKDFDNGGTNNVPGCPICKSDGDSFEPRDSFKGDLARGLFYMDVRFNGDSDDGYGVDLRMWDQVGSSGSQIGKLSTLVAWSLADPPDAGERNRNDLVDSLYQHNRNPFIDHPEWVCSIWGSQVPASLCANNNTAPTTAPMTKTIAEDSGATTVALIANDPDGDQLSWSLATPSAAHGTASIAGSTLTYTPAADFHGQDVVGVAVSDGKGGTAVTTVTITVSPVNDAPIASGQVVSTAQDTARTITLSGTDVDGDTLSYAIASQPGHGSVVLAGAQATYTPAAGYHGSDAFTFTVSDGSLSSAPATVSVNVTAVNHAPVATAQQVSTAQDAARTITLSGTDVDGDTLSYAIASQPGHGSVVLAGAQATYTPAAGYHGSDAFTFTVSDGSLSSAPATVSVNVTAVNHAPVATAQQVSTAQDAARTITLSGTDVDGDTLSYAIASQPGHGSVVLAGAQATYTPAAGYHGSDAFTFTVSDGSLSSAPATVSVNVAEIPSATLAIDAPQATRGTRATITIAATSAEGTVPTGSVTLMSGDTFVAEAELDADGVATLSGIPGRAGTVPLTATYDGDDLFGPTTSPTVTWTVAKAASTMTFDSGVLRRGRAGTIRVAVKTVAGVKAGGSMKLTIAGKKLTTKVVQGVATFKVATLPRTATTKVVAAYAGDTQYKPGSASHTFTLKR